MKRKFTKLMAALALLVFMTPTMVGWGQTTVDVKLSSGSFNNNEITWTCADGNITIQQLKGSGSTNPNSSYISAPRVYKQNILSFVGTNGYTITNIDIKYDGSYYGITKYAGTAISENNNVENNTTSLTPTWSTTAGGTHSIATINSDGISEIYIQNGHSSDNGSTQLRITKLTITYKVSGNITATTVTINTDNLTNTDVYVSTAAGSLTASVTETESGDAVSDASVTWTSSDTGVATIDEDGEVTLVAVGTTTITASYAGGSGYGSSSATYALTVTSSEPYVQPTTIEITPNYTFWGKSGQFSGSTYSELSGEQDNVTLYWTRGSGSTYANLTAMRFYKDNTLTFTAPTGYEITSIVITFTETQDDLSFSPEGYSLSGTTGTWIGSSETVTMSRPSNASSFAQISKFTITLAAVSNTLSVTYNGNGNTGGSVPTDENEYESGDVVTVLDNTGNLAKTGYTWAGWNTQADGNGTNYTAGSIFNITENTTLYAKWNAKTITTLTYTGAPTTTTYYAGQSFDPTGLTVTATFNDNSTEDVTSLVVWTPDPLTVAATSVTGTYMGLTVNIGSLVVTAAPGSQDNPYTVAQAIAATPSNGNVYIQGIVSSFYNTSIVGDGSNYRYYISDDGTTTTQLLVYKGTGLNQATFTNADDLLVGDEVVICGSLITYQNAPEVASGNYLYSWNRPTYPIINANDINLAYDATSGSIAYSITNPTGATLTAISTADWISNIIVGSESVTFTTTANEGDAERTATITLSYTGATDKVINVTQAHYVPDYATLPFAFNSGKNAIEETDGLTQSGLGSDYSDANAKLRFDSTDDYVILKINERPGTLTFNIKNNSFSGGTFKVQTSEDGVTYTDLKTYTEITGTQEEEFTGLGENVRYIKWIYTSKVSGNVGLGNIALAAYVAPGNSAPVWSELPTPTIAVNAEYELDLSNYVTGTPTPAITLATSVSNSLYEFEDGLLMFQPTAAGTYEFTFTATNSEGNASATLTVTAAEVATYTLATSITSGRHYVIAASTSNVTKAMGGKNASKDYYNAIDASIDGNTITVPANSEIQEFVIVGPNAQGYYYIYDPVAGGYLYASSDNNNDLSCQTPNDDNGLWEIDFTNSTVKAQGANTHNLLRYNSGSPRFSCYTSGQTAIAFYEKNETTPQYDFYMDIAAWTVETTDETNYSDGWNFIASPLASDYALTGTDMVSGTYEDFDLYRLNNTTWENYNNSEHTDFTALENGTGYLYANSQDITLHFSGAINEFTTAGGANVKGLSEGWNLIGNPYSIPIYINKDYYKMNAGGTAVESTAKTVVIPACTGVVVNAGANETVTFSTSAPEQSAGNNGNIQMTLAQTVATRGESRTVALDNAIVSFNEGSQLEKFYFMEQNANLYIPQGNEEYAIVSAEAQGELPVNFKAATDGTYTISVEAENLDVNYLHLIDNKTGMDVNLLATPSYTFEARRSDYASRFRLVFSANNVNENDNENENTEFAFISDGNIIISGAQNATVQVVDMLGRVVVSRNSVNTLSTEGIVPGVYVIRLIDGSNVRSQKIVVR